VALSHRETVRRCRSPYQENAGPVICAASQLVVINMLTLISIAMKSCQKTCARKGGRNSGVQPVFGGACRSGHSGPSAAAPQISLVRYAGARGQFTPDIPPASKSLKILVFAEAPSGAATAFSLDHAYPPGSSSSASTNSDHHGISESATKGLLTIKSVQGGPFRLFSIFGADSFRFLRVSL